MSEQQSVGQAPVIIGVRHHSPACARLVAERIRTVRPAHVLIEGPADVNDRIDELHLGHRLPIAVYTYLSSPTGHHTSWAPFAEHSPEWQALTVGREVGARTRFIDLPAWHAAFAELDNRYADTASMEEEQRFRRFEAQVSAQMGIEGTDALWDHVFESVTDLDELDARLTQWFSSLRADTAGSIGNAAREEMMARWIAWAMAEADGPVLVVCGGYHAPGLARRWREFDGQLPQTPLPPDHHSDQVRYGSFLVPYSFRRLDSFTGYASGMPSPAYYQWLWSLGAERAGLRLVEQVRQRLRQRNLPASTATLIAVHTHAHGLARLRGHDAVLRVDWLDAMAASWVNDALDVPLPWSYRGPIRPGTDPVLVEVMDVLAGTAQGALAPGTPQPPLVAAVAAELESHDLPVHGTVELDLLAGPAERSRSQVLHRLRLLDLPGVKRTSGPSFALDGATHSESWSLQESHARLAALIEAGAWGGTLTDAARARWVDAVSQVNGDVAGLAAALDSAVWAGLTRFTDGVLAQLADAVATETDLGALGRALRRLLPLLRSPQLLGWDSLPAVTVTVDAITDRALWLIEPPATIAPGEIDAHLGLLIGLRDLVRTRRADSDVDLLVPAERVVAVLRRKAEDGASDPASRGGALGALISLEEHLATHADPLELLSRCPVGRLGDALAGLMALAREELVTDSLFVAGLDRVVTELGEGEFVGALPALRGAFGWLPARERGGLAEQILSLHDISGASTRVLTGRLVHDPVTVASATHAESEAIAQLSQWGVWPEVQP